MNNTTWKSKAIDLFTNMEKDTTINIANLESICDLLSDNFNSEFIYDEEKSQWLRPLPKESLSTISDNYFCFTIVHLITNIPYPYSDKKKFLNCSVLNKLVSTLMPYLYAREEYLKSNGNPVSYGVGKSYQIDGTIYERN